MVSEAKKRSNKRWDDKHPAERRHRQLKSQTKRFILKEANEDELDWVESLVKEVKEK